MISDGAHGGTNDHFFFLPPLVPRPAVNGTFDGSLEVEVEICEISRCGTEPLSVFTTVDGSGSEAVRVGSGGDHYLVNWHTDRYDLDPDVTYRIIVRAEGGELGFADVDVVGSGRELKNVDTGQYIALKNGRTLPIKFRIEDGALSPPSPLAYKLLIGAFEHPVRPIRRAQTVEEYYGYGSPQGSSANTPDGLEESDVIVAFLYQNTDTGHVSLVLIFDAANDGSGMHARLSMGGLPADAVWSVLDDPGETARSPINADGTSEGVWNLSECCTDGGALSGSFDAPLDIGFAFSELNNVSEFAWKSDADDGSIVAVRVPANQLGEMHLTASYSDGATRSVPITPGFLTPIDPDRGAGPSDDPGSIRVGPGDATCSWLIDPRGRTDGPPEWLETWLRMRRERPAFDAGRAIPIRSSDETACDVLGPLVDRAR